MLLVLVVQVLGERLEERHERLTPSSRDAVEEEPQSIWRAVSGRRNDHGVVQLRQHFLLLPPARLLRRRRCRSVVKKIGDLVL